MRSLFVISLPRSLSSVIYHAARTALGLAEPAWVSDGEVLNADRHAMHGDPRFQVGRKYTRPAEEPRVAEALYSFLDELMRPDGFAYKDVVQPFVVAGWLARASTGVAVMRIKRPLVDVALSMLARRWTYPARPPFDEGLDKALLQGLIDAEAALDAVPAVEVEYDALIASESALGEALGKLTPGQPISDFRYLSAEFRKYRENRLARRESEPYRYLSARLDEVRGGAASRLS